MAEAAVDTNRFFCHSCNQHFGLSSSDLVCPHCNSGFVEQVGENPSDDMSLSSDVEMERPENSDPASIRELLQGSLSHYWPTVETSSSASFGEPGDGISFFSINIQPRNRTTTDGPSSSTQNGEASTSNGPDTSGGARPRTPYNLRSSARANASNGASTSSRSPDVPTAHLIENFLQHLINGTSPAAMFGASTTIQSATGVNPAAYPWAGMFTLHGNPGDYAWGANGLDNIITQLLGQLDSSGAPPASEAAIEKLPTVQLDKELIQKKKECSICMEAFVLDDKAKQLPCQHIFHVKCIEQWLKLHNTCPICRTSIERNNATGCGRNTNSSTTPNNSTASTSGASSSGGMYYPDGRD